MLTFVILMIGVLISWWMDKSFREQAKRGERWLSMMILFVGVGLLCLKKWNVPLVLPSDVLIEWIASPFKQYLIGGGSG